MGSETNPKAAHTPQSAQAALNAAGAARLAAGVPTVPRWFPGVAAAAFAAGMTPLGVGLLTSTRAPVLAGAVILVGFLGLWAALTAWWRRRGIIPAPPRLDPRVSRRHRRIGLSADFAALVLSLSAFAATGSLGWAAIVFGWLGGAAMWYRLAAPSHRARTA